MLIKKRETYAIRIRTQCAARFFCGFGENKSVRTAWSLAGAELFLHDARLGLVLQQLELKKKSFIVVRVVVSHEAVDLDVCPF